MLSPSRMKHGSPQVPRPISPSSHRSCVESPPGEVAIMMNPGFEEVDTGWCVTVGNSLKTNADAEIDDQLINCRIFGYLGETHLIPICWETQLPLESCVPAPWRTCTGPPVCNGSRIGFGSRTQEWAVGIPELALDPISVLLPLLSWLLVICNQLMSKYTNNIKQPWNVSWSRNPIFPYFSHDEFGENHLETMEMTPAAVAPRPPSRRWRPRSEPKAWSKKRWLGELKKLKNYWSCRNHVDSYWTYDTYVKLDNVIFPPQGGIITTWGPDWLKYGRCQCGVGANTTLIWDSMRNIPLSMEELVGLPSWAIAEHLDHAVGSRIWEGRFHTWNWNWSLCLQSKISFRASAHVSSLFLGLRCETLQTQRFHHHPEPKIGMWIMWSNLKPGMEAQGWSWSAYLAAMERLQKSSPNMPQRTRSRPQRTRRGSAPARLEANDLLAW